MYFLIVWSLLWKARERSGFIVLRWMFLPSRRWIQADNSLSDSIQWNCICKTGSHSTATEVWVQLPETIYDGKRVHHPPAGLSCHKNVHGCSEPRNRSSAGTRCPPVLPQSPQQWEQISQQGCNIPVAFVTKKKSTINLARVLSSIPVSLMATWMKFH